MECLSFYCVDSGGNNRSTDELRRHQPHQRQRQQVNRQKNEMDPRKKMSFSSASIEFIYMAASPPCRAVWMCIKELGIEVDMRHIDMYKKAEHTQPWFVKVRKNLWHWHSHGETGRDTKGKREVGFISIFIWKYLILRRLSRCSFWFLSELTSIHRLFSWLWLSFQSFLGDCARRLRQDRIEPCRALQFR